MKTLLAVLTGPAVFLTCVALHAEEPRLIEFRMQPGESANYALHVETRTVTTWHRTRGTEERTVNFESNMRVLIRCVKVSDEGVMHFEITYPDFKMETSMTEEGQTSTIVSDRNGARSYLNGKLQESLTWDQLEKQRRPNLAKLLGSLIEFTLDKRGRVLDAKVPASLAGRAPAVDIKQFFRQQVILPGVPIMAGAEWSESVEREVPQGPGPLHGRMMIDEAAYTYENNETAMGRECARIGIVISSRPKEEIPDLKEFKQSTEGWSLVDLDNGQLIQSYLKLSQDMKGTPSGIRAEVSTTGEVKTNLVLPSTAGTAPAEETAPAEKK